jgi:hypothetical protein
MYISLGLQLRGACPRFVIKFPDPMQCQAREAGILSRNRAGAKINFGNHKLLNSLPGNILQQDAIFFTPEGF